MMAEPCPKERSSAGRPGGWCRLASPLPALLILLLGPLAPAVGSAESGRVAGQVLHRDGGGLGGVAIAVEGGDRRPVTSDARGRFALEGVAAGSRTLHFTLGQETASETVEVAAGKTTEIEKVVDWQYVVLETTTVFSASRRPERIYDAPAAISTITPEQIERGAAAGQLVKLLEFAPGVDVTQNGLFDFKLNSRGLNSSATRRTATLIDGRDVSVPLADAQEWMGLAFPVDDLEAVELLRGPSSALYGANAFNGTLNMITKSPRDSQGGTLRLTAGEQSSARADLRYATALGAGWYAKVLGSFHTSGDFFRSRNQSVEYSEPCPPAAQSFTECLPLEAVPLAFDRNRVRYGGLRFDKDFGAGRSLVAEGGSGQFDGSILASSSARFQHTDTKRPWGRVSLVTPRFVFNASHAERDSEALTLLTGIPAFAQSRRTTAEIQTHWDFSRGRLVAGAAGIREKVDTADPQGVQTLFLEPVGSDEYGVYAQFDYQLHDRLKLVLAGRWDDNTLFDGRLSPQAGLVFSLAPAHTLRLSYNEAFLNPTYVESFVLVPLAAPLDLSFFESLCAPAGVSCGFDRPVPLLGVGNPDLDFEQMDAFEIGYSGILGRKAFLSVDYYFANVSEFLIGGVPQVGTIVGRANKRFGPYMPPSALPAANADLLLAFLQAGLGPFFPFLSNPIPDQPALVLATLINFGEVDNQGAELTFGYAFDQDLALDFSYSWNDLDPKQTLPGTPPLVSNTPEHKLKLGLTYSRDRLSASLRYRWSEAFLWVDGLLTGQVPSYGVVALDATYRLSDAWQVGLNVSNLFDDVHYELFSGDLLERQALAHVAFSW